MPESNFLQSRSCWKKVLALSIPAVLLLTIGSFGFAVMYAPIRMARLPWLRVTSLDNLPANGDPMLFPMVLPHHNGWVRSAAELVGTVFLQRLPDSEQVIALSSASPWLGCQIAYDELQQRFYCVCHPHEHYDRSGKRLGLNPAPRNMDVYEVAIHDDQVSVHWRPWQQSPAN